MNKGKILDEYLILQAQNGDKGALGALVNRWNKKLTSFSYKYTKNNDQAKDIVQDSWIAIIRGINKLKSPSKFPSWAFRIVYNKTIDQLKKTHDLDLSKVNEPQSEEILDHEILDINAELKKLPSIHKTILNLYYLEGMPVKEISKLLSISDGTVKSRIFYAREKLKKNLNI